MDRKDDGSFAAFVLLLIFLILVWLLLKCVSSICSSIWYSIFKRVVAIDTERVGVGYRGSFDALARVSLVDTSGNVILDKYVKPMQEVTDYRTPWSGITEDDLRFAEDYDSVRKKVLNILQNCILVGHDLRGDLMSLGWNHPTNDTRDTALYMPFRRMFGKNLHEKLSLKFLAEKILGRQIQVYEHSSVEDAKAAMDIYLCVAKQWEAEY